MEKEKKSEIEEYDYELISKSSTETSFKLNKKKYLVKYLGNHNGLDCLEVNGKRVKVSAYRDKRGSLIVSHNNKDLIMHFAKKGSQNSSNHSDNQLTSPMPGKVLKVMVKSGDKVKKDDGLLIIEAMKMEHLIKSPYDGIIKNVIKKSGDQVDLGEELIQVDKDDE